MVCTHWTIINETWKPQVPGMLILRKKKNADYTKNYVKNRWYLLPWVPSALPRRNLSYFDTLVEFKKTNRSYYRKRFTAAYVLALVEIQTTVCTYWTISIGNSMVSSAIWEKHALVSFSKTYKIARVRRTSAICAFLKNSWVHVFPKFHEKPYYYLIIIYI